MTPLSSLGRARGHNIRQVSKRELKKFVINPRSMRMLDENDAPPLVVKCVRQIGILKVTYAYAHKIDSRRIRGIRSGIRITTQRSLIRRQRHIGTRMSQRGPTRITPVPRLAAMAVRERDSTSGSTKCRANGSPNVVAWLAPTPSF